MNEPPRRKPPGYALLLVDDEPVVTETMQAFLAGGLPTADIVTAASAEGAMQLLASRPFDLVVADHFLPGRNGVELLGVVSRWHPRCRRVLLTGGTSPELARLATDGPGIHGYIQKPYARERVVHLVRGLLEAPPGREPRVEERAILLAMGRARTSAWRSAPTRPSADAAEDAPGDPGA